ncbi:MAG: hypothetical protein WA614_02355 [Acidimicrobiales bacterium]|jgi:hypothetical protein
MRSITLVPVAIGLAIAAAGCGGIASAAPKVSKPVLAAGPHVPKSGGKVNLTSFSNNDGPTSKVVLTGSIGDYGNAVRMSTGGSLEDNELKLEMTRGSFRLDIAVIESELVQSAGSGFPTNQATCSGLLDVTAASPIVSGSGTGAYRGIHGTLHLTISINEVESWPVCPETDTSPYLSQTAFITGSGLVTLK